YNPSKEKSGRSICVVSFRPAYVNRAYGFTASIEPLEEGKIELFNIKGGQKIQRRDYQILRFKDHLDRTKGLPVNIRTDLLKAMERLQIYEDSLG
ncbi:MAG: hypothetical protein AABY10_05895, partial [Nanoarchaeota archaeon]